MWPDTPLEALAFMVVAAVLALVSVYGALVAWLLVAVHRKRRQERQQALLKAAEPVDWPEFERELDEKLGIKR